MSSDDRRSAYVGDLVARVGRRTSGSKRIAAAGRPMLVNPSVLGKFHISIKEIVYPIVARSASGARFVDVDGNEYVDMLMGFGVNLYGHNPPFVIEALREELGGGLLLGLRDDVAGDVARAISQLTGFERVFFCNSGTEAVMGAIRLARAVTGRPKVAIFAGSYHGHSDATLARGTPEGESVPIWSGVAASTVKDTIVLEYGTEKALEIVTARAKELAAVLVEPVQARRPALQPREFLHALRAATRSAGVALVFDEMVTGFRLSPAGAQDWFDVRADLAAYGKVLAGGMPIGAIAGNGDFMNAADGGAWEFGDFSCPFAMPTFVSGTFCKHPLAMAAARAVTARLQEAGELHANLNARSQLLVDGVNALLEEAQATVRLTSCGSILSFCKSGSSDPPPSAGAGSALDLLHYELLSRGVHCPRGPAHFLSAAHAEADVAAIIEAFRGSLGAMQAGGIVL